MPPPPLDFFSSPSTTSAPDAHRSPSARVTPGTARTSSISPSLSELGGAELARERLFRGDLYVDAGIDRAVQLSEAAAHLIGQHVCAGDHRDAEQHRDRGERGAQLALAESPKGETRHASSFRWSRICSCEGRVRRSTIRPSARNSTESAIAAAPAVVGHHHDRLAELVDGPAQQLEHVATRVRVEIAGRLVGEHDRRPRDERARHRDALRLSAGELVGSMGAAVLEPDRPDQGLAPGLVRLVAADPNGEQNVLLGIEYREQVVALEDEADLLATQQRQLAIRERVEPSAGDLDPTTCGLVEPSQNVHERRLAGAGRAHDRCEMPRSKSTLTPRSASTAPSPSPKRRVSS